MQQDWRDTLSALSLPDPDEHLTHPPVETCHGTSAQTAPLHIFFERKGRAGKSATIITGFTIPEAEIKEVAAKIKRALGCGGSVRGGEILFQGDCTAKCRTLLAQMGFKAK